MCDRFFPDEPEYDIEILEWIVEEDYTVEWEYVWGVKLKEPVFLYQSHQVQSAFSPMKYLW